MTGPEIVTKVQQLRWPEGSYVVFGSCPMALAGIREAQDIDFLVSPELFQRLIEEGWAERDKGPTDKPRVYEDFEAHQNWGFSHYAPTLTQLLSTATVVNNVAFASLEEVRKWKASGNRPKDKADVKLIDSYLKKTSV